MYVFGWAGGRDIGCGLGVKRGMFSIDYFCWLEGV